MFILSFHSMADCQSAQQFEAFLKVNGLEDLLLLMVESSISDTNQLISILADSARLEVYDLPSAAVSQLKGHLELQIEFVLLGSSIKPKHEAFFKQYSSVAALQIDPWSLISQSLNEQFDYKEINHIKRLWSCNSPLRQSLMEAYLPVELADDVERNGIYSIGGIPPADFVKYSQALTSSERASFIQLYQAITQSSIQQRKEREEIESKLLRQKIEKAQEILNHALEAEDDSVKVLKMAELNQVLDLPCFNEEYLESLNDTLKSLLRFLDESTDHPLLSDEDLCCSASSESVLRGLVVGFDPSAIIDQAAGQFMSKPNLCPVTLLSWDPVIQPFDFYSQESANTFQKLISSAGASFGEEMFKLDQSSEMTSENNNNNTVVSNCFLRLICYRFPTASFQLERSQMVFTSSAMAQLRAISNLSSAEEFMAHYGSHIQTGRFQLGEILWRKIHVTSEKQATHQDHKKL